MSVPVATTAQVARDHTVIAERDPDALVVTALRTKSVHAREILAAAAWPGHTPAEVESWAVVHPAHAVQPDRAQGRGEFDGRGKGDWPRLEADMVPAWIARYAQVLAVQTGDLAERAAARRMLEAVHRSAADALPDRAVELLLQLRVAERDRSATELAGHPAVRPPVGRAALADLANPALFADADEQTWLRALNEALLGPDAAPLALRPATGADGEVLPPLDRLTAPDAAPVDAPHLVTVLMSAFRPGRPILTALRSLREQTWGNLEILVIDDASGPDFGELLDQAQALDPRIRLIRKGINGGTYRARNTALRQSHGDFIIVLDSDDWLHPQAIETAMRVMESAPQVMATIGLAARVSEDIELNRPGYQPLVISAPSLMFRTHPVMDRLGYFDPTRKGADTEYAKRIEAAFGKHAVRTMSTVVALMRGGDTLSSSEFSRGWRHGARHEYKCAYRPWHRRITAGQELPFLDPAAPRRFPEPRRWATPLAPDLGRPGHIDLCVAGDWRRFGGPQRSMLEEIRAALDAGLRVAVMHLEAFRFMTKRDEPLCEPVSALIASGTVEWIHPDDDVDIDILLIRYPPILQYPPAPGARTVRAAHVLIVSNQGTMETDGSDQRYVVADVTARTRELFGREPVWVPQSPLIRDELEADPSAPQISAWDNPGIIDLEHWSVRHRGAPSAADGPIVVGRYSRDNAMKFPPDWPSLKRAYEFGPDYEVRMLGARNTVSRLLTASGLTREDRPDNWVVMKHKQVDVLEFLRDLDFFLYLDHPERIEPFGRVLLEAAASGVLTIADPRHRRTFGDIVDYAPPGEAQDLIANYVADPERYLARVARSQALVQERFGHRNFVAKLRSLGDGAAGSQDRSSAGHGSGVSTHGMDDTSGDGLGPLSADQGDVGVGGPGGSSVAPQVRGWHARTERIRSAADATRTDALTVVHRDGAGAEISRWWADQLAAHPGDGLPQAMVDTAPEAVGALVTRRDGLVHVAWREHVLAAREATGAYDPMRQPGVTPDQGLLRLSGITVPAGWAAEAWWDAAAPALTPRQEVPAPAGR